MNPHPALSQRCPFCHAEGGQPCRTERGRGRELDSYHSRRVEVSRPIADRHQVTRVNALCCTCGNLRTVSSDYYYRHHDPEHADSARGKAEGWRKTQALKCAACGERTRHAILQPSNAYRDWDESRQLIALGDDAGAGQYAMSDEHIEQLRREYRELFPRNPYLRHRRWTADAEKAWDDGTKKVTALCGEQIEIKVDPRRPNKYAKQETPGALVAEQLSDTEYEDPETGLWWLDMSCVDCCRVSNNLHRAERRKLMVEWLVWLYARPERVPDEYVDALIKVFEAATSRQRTARTPAGD